MQPSTVRIGSNGRFVIPAPYRRLLGVEEGDELVVRFEDGELRLTTRDLAVARAKAMVKRVAPQDGSLTDELLATRRATSGRHTQRDVATHESRRDAAAQDA